MNELAVTRRLIAARSYLERDLLRKLKKNGYANGRQLRQSRLLAQDWIEAPVPGLPERLVATQFSLLATFDGL